MIRAEEQPWLQSVQNMSFHCNLQYLQLPSLCYQPSWEKNEGIGVNNVFNVFWVAINVAPNLVPQHTRNTFFLPRGQESGGQTWVA
jgi:hypothetical protein